ncbi:hypothetical protein [Paenibacillus castaneae]|uniref:hypothetical protein n=1 Tax=Paenibacillus castaneae TaxID=474957 RepID=UPI001ABB74C8|nr:hypothetical protein [Paenibacillus castaneae]
MDKRIRKEFLSFLQLIFVAWFTKVVPCMVKHVLPFNEEAILAAFEQASNYLRMQSVKQNDCLPYLFNQLD